MFGRIMGNSMTRHNVVSISGGKDSTALLLLAIERETPNLSAVFADTGNEHPYTYAYVQYLIDKFSDRIPFQWVRASFAAQIAKKREYVLTKWADKGVSQDAIIRAADALKPTGNPFLDLCIWKGRFPSTKARFCSEELKRNVIIEQVQEPLLANGDEVVSWQGVRADESPSRAALPVWEEVGGGLFNYRPILQWTVEEVFAMHDRHGIEPNPLYKLGMARVGCMPCIHSRKDELLEISKRFPDQIDRIDQWEIAVKRSSKRFAATFFANPGMENDEAGKGTIRTFVEWAKTARGGHQYDFIRMEEAAVCSSIYGLCE